MTRMFGRVTVNPGINKALTLGSQVFEGFLVERVQAFFEGRYNFSQFPGFAASLQESGEPIFEQYRGQANIENSIPINSSSRFHVASLSKQITAFLFTLIESRGLIDQRAPATKYLSDYPNLDDDIRIIDLLKHTSGLRDQWELLDWAGWRGSDLITSSDVEKIIKRQPHNPIEKRGFRYSNTGYFLIAQILERVCGQDFSDLARSEIFEPLSMNDTAFRRDASKPLHNYAVGYSIEDQAEGIISVNSPNLCVPGPTSLITSLPDFMKWEAELAAPRYFDQDLILELFVDDNELVGQSPPYGRGFMLTESDLGPIVFHSGRDFGASAIHVRHVPSGLTSIILANVDALPLWDLAHGLIALGLDRPIPMPMFLKEKNVNARHKLWFKGGLFRNDQGDFLYAEINNNSLSIKGFLDIRLTRTGREIFADNFGDLTIGFSGAGKQQSLVVETKLQKLFFREYTPTCSGEACRGGVFYSSDLEAVATISPENETMTICLPKGREHKSYFCGESIAVFDKFWCLRRGKNWDNFTMNSARAKNVEFIRIS